MKAQKLTPERVNSAITQISNMVSPSIRTRTLLARIGMLHGLLVAYSLKPDYSILLHFMMGLDITIDLCSYLDPQLEAKLCSLHAFLTNSEELYLVGSKDEQIEHQGTFFGDEVQS